MNLQQAIIKQLAAAGVRRIYGVSGDTYLTFLDEMTRQNEIEFVLTASEVSAAFMASAEAKLTGGLGVCMATEGPGATNLLSGLGDAFLDGVPVLAITGQTETAKRTRRVKQEIPLTDLYRPMTLASAELLRPETGPSTLARLCRQALFNRGPVHLSVPKDLWTMGEGLQPEAPAPYATSPQTPDSEVLAQAKAWLAQARRPAILAGRGTTQAGEALAEFARSWGAPIVFTLPARGTLPDSDPLVMGGVGQAGGEAGRRVLEEADRVMICGARWWPEDFLPQSKPILQVDRDPAVIGERVVVEFGLVGDLSRILTGLARNLPNPDGQWLSRVDGFWKEWVSQRDAYGDCCGVEPAYVMQELRRVLEPDAIISVDTGDHTLWLGRNYCFRQEDVLVSGWWRSMGWGLPAAIAANLTWPHRQVCAVVGDGSLLMSLGELGTAVRQSSNILLVVMRNGGLVMEENKMRQGGLTPAGTQLVLPDFKALAESWGWQAWKVQDSSQLGGALADARRAQGLALVEVEVSSALVPHTQL